jgi:flagellar basal-body rod modification protein FlgD
MATVSSTTPGSSSAAANSQTQDIQLPAQTLNQGDFLQLLVAQLSAQDPLNPESDTDFAAQMAQFSTLQETQTMQQSVTSLQASDLVGKTVQVESDKGATSSGVVSAVTFSSGVPSLTVNGTSYNLSQMIAVSRPPTTGSEANSATK